MKTIKDELSQLVDRSSEENTRDRRRHAQRVVMDKIGDPELHPSIAAKAVDAVFDGRLPKSPLFDLLHYVEAKRQKGHLEKPGAYFVVSLKRLFARHGIQWQQLPKATDRHDLF